MSGDTIAKEIFICYSRKDSKVVERIVDALEARGCQCWMDRHGIAGSDLWRHSIALALESARAVLFFASESSYQSLHVARELSLAEQKCHPILPLRLDRAPIPTGQFQLILAGIHYINYSPEEEQAAVEQIIASMAAITASRTGVDSPKAAVASPKRAAAKNSAAARYLFSLCTFGLVAAAASYFTWKWANHRPLPSQVQENPLLTEKEPIIAPNENAEPKPVNDTQTKLEIAPPAENVSPTPTVITPTPPIPVEVDAPASPGPASNETRRTVAPVSPSAPENQSPKTPVSPGRLQPALDGEIEIRPPGS